ncbi:MAG: GntR family transcriptional regulator [Lachnospiraceae bacterium]|jgi:GntR family transcriptional regulator|nr:GntR family transcriptional regulator [Lachnospiraceae bacterium]
MQVINYQDGRPIYEQIVDYYKHLILMGAMETDEQMPSVRSLAVDLATNPNTVQKAYAQLEREGFIYTVKGRGNFVKENSNLVCARQDEICNKILELLKEAKEIGINPKDILKTASERIGND